MTTRHLAILAATVAMLISSGVTAIAAPDFPVPDPVAVENARVRIASQTAIPASLARDTFFGFYAAEANVGQIEIRRWIGPWRDKPRCLYSEERLILDNGQRDGESIEIRNLVVTGPQWELLDYSKESRSGPRESIAVETLHGRRDGQSFYWRHFRNGDLTTWREEKATSNTLAGMPFHPILNGMPLAVAAPKAYEFMIYHGVRRRYEPVRYVVQGRNTRALPDGGFEEAFRVDHLQAIDGKWALASTLWFDATSQLVQIDLEGVPAPAIARSREDFTRPYPTPVATARKFIEALGALDRTSLNEAVDFATLYAQRVAASGEPPKEGEQARVHAAVFRESMLDSWLNPTGSWAQTWGSLATAMRSDWLRATPGVRPGERIVRFIPPVIDLLVLDRQLEFTACRTPRGDGWQLTDIGTPPVTDRAGASLPTFLRDSLIALANSDEAALKARVDWEARLTSADPNARAELDAMTPADRAARIARYRDAAVPALMQEWNPALLPVAWCAGLSESSFDRKSGEIGKATYEASEIARAALAAMGKAWSVRITVTRRDGDWRIISLERIA